MVQYGSRTWQVSLRETGLRYVNRSYRPPPYTWRKGRCAVPRAAPFQQAIPAAPALDEDLVTTTIPLPPLTEVRSPSFALNIVGSPHSIRLLNHVDVQELAKEVLSDYGFDLIKTKADAVFKENRASTALLIHPKNIGAKRCI